MSNLDNLKTATAKIRTYINDVAPVALLLPPTSDNPHTGIVFVLLDATVYNASMVTKYNGYIYMFYGNGDK